MSRQLISISLFLALLWIGSLIAPVLALSNEEPAGETAVVLFQDTPAEDTQVENGGASFFDGLGVIFAILSVYVVTMFTMAIGTEILVDIIKGFLGKPLGLKSHPNVRQKLDEYEKFLPGVLDDLGVSAAARLKLEKQIEDLKDVLEPAFTAEAAAKHFRREEITEGLMTLGFDWHATESVEKIKEATRAQLNKMILRIDVNTTLGQTVQRSLEKGNILQNTDRAIERAYKRLDQSLNPDAVYDAVSFVVSGEIADGVTSWANAFMRSMRTKSYEAALSTYEGQLRPQLREFGLGDTLQNKVESQFESFLENLKVYRGTDIYLESLNSFLLEVERQRTIVRSSAGKLRDWIIDMIKKGLRIIPFVQHPGLAPELYDPLITDSSKAAAKLLDLDEYDKEQNKKRIRRIRLLSFILGTILAYIMQIDSADLLADLFPNNSNFLELTLIRGNSFLLRWVPNVLDMSAPIDLNAGVLLTGLAASAGSTFWHDQLARLQAAKQGVEQAQAVLQPIIMESRQNK